MARKLDYVAAEGDPLYLHALKNRFSPNAQCHGVRVESRIPGRLRSVARRFDSAICINVLESVKDPVQVLDSLGHCLKTGGTLVVLVPQGKDLYGSLDEAMGHRRRFSSADLAQALGQPGLRCWRFISS